MKKILLKLINFYKKRFSTPLSLFFGPGCRYSPTCSQYAWGAISKFGLVKGGKMALLRFFSCNPYSKRNSYDPVPLKVKK